jgi:hypothetical protein
MSITRRSSSARARRRSPTRRFAGRSESAAAPNAGLAYKLTIRRGPKVERDSFESLDEAIGALERGAKDIRSEGPLPARRLVRDFEPGDLVAGRVEISTGGTLRRGVTAGVDVMGDGRYVAFRGGIGREELDFSESSPFAAVRRVLEA